MASGIMIVVLDDVYLAPSSLLSEDGTPRLLAMVSKYTLPAPKVSSNVCEEEVEEDGDPWKVELDDSPPNDSPSRLAASLSSMLAKIRRFLSHRTRDKVISLTRNRHIVCVK